MDGFDFWGDFEKSIYNRLSKDEKIIRSNIAGLSEKGQKAQLVNIELTKETFESLFNEDIHNKLRSEGTRRLSQKATLNALFILLYKDEPILQTPYRLLSSLMDIDENFTVWRYHHALMAQRMLGTKIGTGGSSGHMYLKKAAENNRVYEDLFNLSTFLVSKADLPDLPDTIKEKLNLTYEK